MDMAPQRAESRGAAPVIGTVAVASRDRPAGPSKRALATLQSATQATMMMALVWPLVVAMPFFWAPPLWVMAGIGRGQPPR
jgi:hypothetical protein